MQIQGVESEEEGGEEKMCDCSKLDMRGLSLEERKQLLEWFFIHTPVNKLHGKLVAWRWLKELGEEDMEFVLGNVSELVGESGEEEEEEVEKGRDHNKIMVGYR